MQNTTRRIPHITKDTIKAIKKLPDRDDKTLAEREEEMMIEYLKNAAKYGGLKI